MIKLNEVQYAEDLLDKHSGLVSLSDLILLAKYFSYKKVDIREELKKYISQCITEYNEVVYDRYLDFAIKQTENSVIRTATSVPITRNEIVSILSLEGNICQRVALCLLVVSKFYLLNPAVKDVNMEERLKKKVYFNGSWRDVFKLARTTYNVKQKNKIIVELCNAGFLELTEYHNFIIIPVEPVGEVVDSIYLNEDIAYYIAKLKGERIIQCERCGRLVKINNKKNYSQKYCTACKNIVVREQTKARVQKFRNT